MFSGRRKCKEGQRRCTNAPGRTLLSARPLLCEGARSCCAAGRAQAARRPARPQRARQEAPGAEAPSKERRKTGCQVYDGSKASCNPMCFDTAVAANSSQDFSSLHWQKRVRPQ